MTAPSTMPAASRRGAISSPVSRFSDLVLAPRKSLNLVSKEVKHAAGLAVRTAVCQFLDAIAQADLEEDPAVVRRRFTEQ